MTKAEKIQELQKRIPQERSEQAQGLIRWMAENGTHWQGWDYDNELNAREGL